MCGEDRNLVIKGLVFRCSFRDFRKVGLRRSDTGVSHVDIESGNHVLDGYNLILWSFGIWNLDGCGIV